MLVKLKFLLRAALLQLVTVADNSWKLKSNRVTAEMGFNHSIYMLICSTIFCDLRSMIGLDYRELWLLLRLRSELPQDEIRQSRSFR